MTLTARAGLLCRKKVIDMNPITRAVRLKMYVYDKPNGKQTLQIVLDRGFEPNPEDAKFYLPVGFRDNLDDFELTDDIEKSHSFIGIPDLHYARGILESLNDWKICGGNGGMKVTFEHIDEIPMIVARAIGDRFKRIKERNEAKK